MVAMATVSSGLPKKFTLGAVTWDVVEMAPLHNVYGSTHVDQSKVVVLSTLPQPVKEQTFYHELVHCILFAMGKQMPHDEEFVDGFATFLHQYEHTKK